MLLNSLFSRIQSWKCSVTDGSHGSSAAWDFPLPPWLPSVTLHFQDWILENNEFRSTRRLAVPIF